MTARDPREASRERTSRQALVLMMAGMLPGCGGGEVPEKVPAHATPPAVQPATHATGLIPPTPEQRKAMEEMPRVESVPPNRLGTMRINEERAKKGLPPLPLPEDNTTAPPASSAPSAAR